MKTVKDKKAQKKETDQDVKRELDEILRDSALQGALLIQEMIADDKASDASRLAAAKYAVERFGSEQPTEENATLDLFMEIIRQMRANKELEPPKTTTQLLKGEVKEPKKEDSSDFGDWIKTNLN